MQSKGDVLVEGRQSLNTGVAVALLRESSSLCWQLEDIFIAFSSLVDIINFLVQLNCKFE